MAKFKENGKLKLLIIVGTRPEIIRLSAVINKCREYLDCLLAHTGQNYDYNLNGVFFMGNHAKAEMSALYHTFIASRALVACKARTCQMMGLSVLKYFKDLFAAIAAGRTDYKNMLPMTLGVCRAA